MRRILAGSTAFLALTATFLVLPVYVAPAPAAEPVSTSSDLIELGSVDAPAPAAEVQAGTTDPVAGVPDTAPTLTVSRTGVEEFSLVGVTWAYDPEVDDTRVQVRVQGGDGAWGEWTEVGAETADQGTGTETGAQLRGGTSPLWTGPSTGVDVELVTRSGAQPTDVQLDLVDPGESAADTSLTTPAATGTAHAAASMPPVYSRAQWGADESIRTWDPDYAPTVKAATLHHTADTNNYTADQVPAMMRSIYRYHTVSLGWGDIGYNVIVDKFGRLWEGRYGGLASTVIGAHAGGFNTSTFGVSMLGNYDLVAVPNATVDAVVAIIAWKFSLFGLDPRATTVLTSSGGGTSRYAPGARVTLPTIFGHRDVGSTVCPGKYGYARLPEIRDAVAAKLVSVTPQIRALYDSDAGLRAVLGAPVGPEVAAGSVGTGQRYERGWIYWSSATGAHATSGGIGGVHLVQGGPGGTLGLPVTDMVCELRDGGCGQGFAGGSIYWSPRSGAQAVSGGIRALWAAGGWETGQLGYPVSGMRCGFTGGGCGQVFQGGSIYWSPATGPHTVTTEVQNAWARTGWEAGSLGYPVTDAVCGMRDGGCGQGFQRGSIYWSPATGVHPVEGGIRALWAAAGWEAGWVGYPVSDMRCGFTGGGCGQVFQGGSIYWSPATGPHTVSNEVQNVWARTGWEAGSLGYPVTDAVCGMRDGGCGQGFQRGSIYWSPATGVHPVEGGIRALWASTGWETGELGYPTEDMRCGLTGGGCRQEFSGGTVAWSPATGVHAVTGALRTSWLARGAEAGPGWPTGDLVVTSTGAEQRFLRGTLVYDAYTGLVFTL